MPEEVDVGVVGPKVDFGYHLIIRVATVSLVWPCLVLLVVAQPYLVSEVAAARDRVEVVQETLV